MVMDWLDRTCRSGLLLNYFHFTTFPIGIFAWTMYAISKDLMSLLVSSCLSVWSGYVHLLFCTKSLIPSSKLLTDLTRATVSTSQTKNRWRERRCDIRTFILSHEHRLGVRHTKGLRRKQLVLSELTTRAQYPVKDAQTK
jgi:hypothetical protein